MPEGDTIFRAARTLHRVFAGKTVTRFESMYPALTRIADDHSIVGRTIESVSARGKHLLIAFSGNLVIQGNYDEAAPHLRRAREAAKGELPVGSAVALGSALAPRESRLPDLRPLDAGAREDAAYAELIESAIARSDVAALAYELGRADEASRAGLSKELVEAALRRLGVLPDGQH